MIVEHSRRAVLALALCVASFLPDAPARAAEEVVFTYVQRAGDPAYEPNRTYTGLTLRTRYRPIEGANTALRESRILGRAAGVKFVLTVREMGETDDVVSTIMDATQNTGSQVFLLDLPLAEMKRAASSLAAENILLFNPRHSDLSLRREDCSPVMFHTLPSQAMIMDALSQYLRKRQWTQVLVLQGEHEADARMTRAFAKSAKKFGLQVIDTRPFKLSNNPRDRDANNIALLTAGEYDVVFLADTIGEFGRYVPFQTQLPRPVMGSEGLRSSAWHWTWERHGAPQLNQRFDKRAKRRMNDTDWAAWAAVRSVVEAIVRTGSTDPSIIAGYLTSDTFVLDAYKGTPTNFRSWNNQLRQPILLHSHNAVIARAPIDGFLHSINKLDTLGLDHREAGCKLK